VFGAIFIGGYCSDAELNATWAYNLCFLDDRLLLLSERDRTWMAEVAYADIRGIEVGGPGLVKSGGGFVGGGFGLAGAVEGMAIAGALNALTSRTSITTVLQIQATGGELFFLHTEMLPGALRMQLSRAIVAIRNAKANAAPTESGGQAGPASRLDELERLARLLKDGLLTREEFDQLKARLIAGS
jgi:Short C-terminal domain